MQDNPLADFFKPSVELADLPALFPLLRAREALNAFITLFRGGDDEVLIRLMILREIGGRAEAPRWSPQELKATFAYLDPTKLNTVLNRLRENELLVWDNDESVYQLSSSARMALAAIATLLGFSEDDDAELGFITAQVAAGQSVGKVSVEALQHLLGRLNELQAEFEQAVLSASEFVIRAAQKKLDSVWHWVEKGTEIIRAITADDELDGPTHRVAQAIGQAQSRMLRMTAVFQRTLNNIQSQRVHLGESGMTSTDIADWLRRQGVHATPLLNGCLQAHPQPVFVTESEMLDIAEYELLEREREQVRDAIIPSALDAPTTDHIEIERLLFAEDFRDSLTTLDQPQPIADVALGANYAQTAYRMSLLALLNDPESQALNGPVADIARLPLRLDIQAELAMVNKNGVAQMSGGVVKPKGPR
ncbi:hypothetical protein HNQ59_001111 [Chitinivorax tropicus]|uniref:Uncharacterized protein n=1 Tax=Chitinivorax tropicus TaxID=714531 RepID=A0A840MRJ5_9PROT|nr:hypothetical protein [Chitinivorax tropicus]MBB5017841.1 hypothetical protein [Chitinivorax tropicus]